MYRPVETTVVYIRAKPPREAVLTEEPREAVRARADSREELDGN